MGMDIETIIKENINFGFILRKNFCSEETAFITNKNLSLQFAYMKFDKGDHIKPHIHNQFKREISSTNEVLVIKKGALIVSFFNFEKVKIHTVHLYEGDIIFLQEGGHSFDFTLESEIYEIKNGPYLGQKIDKLKF